MNVLILANSDLGLYKFRKELIEELLVKGYCVYIAAPYGEFARLLEKMGCVYFDTPVERRKINIFTDLALLLKYRIMINQTDPDIIITYTIKPNIYGGMMARAMGKKYVVNITGLGSSYEKVGFTKLVVKILYRIVLKTAKVVFVENSSIRKELIINKLCSEDMICLLEGAGVNTDYYNYWEYPENEVFRFLFIGRIMKEKGIDELLSATRKIIDEGKECIVDVVGPLEEDYDNVIRLAESQGWLKYHGFQKDVRSIIAACDCFVLPSYHEGMANTNLECASSGRPVITSDIPGCREAVFDGKTGLLCNVKDTNSLYMMMNKIMAIPRNERKEMGIAGREHIRAGFERREVVNRTIQEMMK